MYILSISPPLSPLLARTHKVGYNDKIPTVTTDDQHHDDNGNHHCSMLKHSLGSHAMCLEALYVQTTIPFLLHDTAHMTFNNFSTLLQ
jgi:hypothetical protein